MATSVTSPLGTLEWLWRGQAGLAGPAASGSALADLFLHFAALSLLSVRGAMTTAPDMQRFVVGERGWLGDAQFTASVALAQAAPGPNVLFVALLGWNIAGLANVLATLVGKLLPSGLLVLAVDRLGAAHREARWLRAFNIGMASLVLGLLLSTAWLLAQPTLASHSRARAALAACSAGWLQATRARPSCPALLGAAAGALGLFA